MSKYLKDPQTGDVRHCEHCEQHPATRVVETDHGAADCCDSTYCKSVLTKRLQRKAKDLIVGTVKKVIAGESVEVTVHGDGTFSCTPRRKTIEARDFGSLIREVDEYLRKLKEKREPKPAVPFIGMVEYGPTYDGSYCGVDMRNGDYIFKQMHPKRREMVSGRKPKFILRQSGSRAEVDRLAKAVKDAKEAYDAYVKKHASKLGILPYCGSHTTTREKQAKQKQVASQVIEAQNNAPEDGGSE